MRTVIAGCALAFMSAVSLSAQTSGCEALLAQGVFNTIQQSASNSSNYSIHQALCMGKIQQSSGGDTVGGGASIVIPGTTIPLGLNFNDAQNFQNVYKSTFCSNFDSGEISKGDLSTFKMIADPAVIQGYNTCVASRQRGLQTDFTVTHDKKVVTFQMSFVAPVQHVAAPKVTKVSVIPSGGATCTGLTAGTELNANQSTLICSRSDTNAVTITIVTTAGNVQADLEAIPPPPTLTAVIMKAMPKGVILPWTDMSIPIPDGWHLADGSNGTLNMTGRVLMGVDKDHPIGEANEGSLTHVHTFKTGQVTDTSSDPGSNWHIDPNCCGGQGIVQPAFHKHSLSGVTTDPQSSLPPVMRVNYIQKIS